MSKAVKMNFKGLNTEKTPPSFLQILANYISICYYIGVVPFRLYFDKTRGLWKIHTSNIQKVYNFLT